MFRKLVKPMFKRSNSSKDLEADCDSPAVSRRGSRLSSRSGSSRCVDLQVEDAEVRGKKEEVHRRWRRVLSVSKAVGRYHVYLSIIKEMKMYVISIHSRFSSMARKDDEEEKV